MSDATGLLFSDDAWNEDLITTSDAAKNFFTGELVEKNDPEKYLVIKNMLLEGTASQREIAKLCKCSRNTVRVVLERIAGENLEPIRRKLASDNFAIAAMTNDRMKELLADDAAISRVNLRDLAVAGAVATDKAQLLSGEATARIDHTCGPSRADFEKTYEEALAEVIEVSPPMGMGTGENKQKALPEPDPAGRIPAAGDGSPSDNISDASKGKTQ